MSTPQAPQPQGQPGANPNAPTPPQPAGGAAQPNQPRPNSGQPYIRPEQVASLPHLTPEQKVQFETGIRNLWNVIKTNPPESEARNVAVGKLNDVTLNLKQAAQRHRAEQQRLAQGQGQAMAGAPGHARPAPGGQGQQQGAPGQAGPGVRPGQPGVPSVPPQMPQLPPEILAHVQALVFALPPNLPKGGPEATQWLQDARARYSNALHKLDQAKTRLGQLTATYNSRMAKGQPFTPEEMTEFNHRKTTYGRVLTEHKTWLEKFRAQQAEFKSAKKPGVATTEGGHAGVSAPVVSTTTTTASVSSGPASAGVVAGTMGGAGPATAATAGRSGPGQASVPAASGAPRPAGSGAPQNQTVAAVSTPPQTGAAQTQLPEQSQPQQSQAPAPQPPQAAANATPTGPPRALSHEDAMAQAARQYSSSNVHAGGKGAGAGAGAGAAAGAGGGAPAGGAPPGGLPNTSATPTSATYPSLPPHPNNQAHGMHSHHHPHNSIPSNRAHTPTHPGSQHAHHSPAPSAANVSREINTTKMPIPKTLGVAPDQPFAIAPSRPSYSGGASTSNSMMGQPSLPKMPGFELEGQPGERVLSKKKLDELVRQVTGAGASSSGGEALTAEVEEAILTLADTFVDSLLTSACQLAKLRANPTLELRDVQLILERNYNIRVPGYASDEIRTVRKFAPAPGWTQKMGAVQAAKISGAAGVGNGEGK